MDLLKSKRDAGMDQVLDCFLLNGRLVVTPETASLQPCLEQLTIPINVDNEVVGETSLTFALMNVHARAEGARKHAADLRRLMMTILSSPLSVRTLGADVVLYEALLLGEDDTDDALGSVSCIPEQEDPRFADLP